ncbi:MAG: hypothetical protein HC837_12205 [Chloroflexaceae bacterium]|nr:hypothetical protein [Chloroflexaceae bacterium]
MATDWGKQAEDMIKNWTGAQQKMWESWVSTMKGMSAGPTADAWQSSIDQWKTSVNQALDAQLTWTQFWADSVVSGAGSSKQMTDWSNQVLEMTKRWKETQTQLWDNWFDTLKKSDPSTMAKNWNPEEMQKMMQVWQESAQKAMEAQMEMARMWASSSQTGTKA